MSIIDTIVDLFRTGGMAVMLAITACLFTALYIIVERTYKLFIVYETSNSQAVMAQIQKLIMNNSIENAIRFCKKMRPNLLPVVLAEGLKRANDSAEEVENAVEHATLSTLPKVDEKIPLLGTLANVATLLGLLGTLFGLIHSFDGAAKATGAEKQKILAEGIAEALTATSYGLSTAMLCLMAFGFLSWKQTKIKTAIMQYSSRLIDLLYTRQVKIRRSSSK